MKIKVRERFFPPHFRVPLQLRVCLMFFSLPVKP
jgi:hypothetical protein